MNILRYNIDVVYDNQVRTITVNSSLYINEVIRRILNVYDVSIYDVAGIYFYNNLEIIYLDSTNNTGFDYLFSFFYNNYQANRFYIETMAQHNNRINARMNYLVQQFQNNFIYRNQPVGNNPITINNYYNNHTTNTNNRRRNRNRNNDEMAPAEAEQAPAPTQNQGRLYEIIFDTANVNLDNYINNIWNTMLNRDTAFNALPRGTYQSLREQNIIHQECLRCGISLEDFQDDSEIVVLPCRHAFMEAQIRRWIITDRHTTCPTCRAPVSNANVNANQT